MVAFIPYGIREFIAMNKKKIIILCVALALLLAVVATLVVLKVQREREAEALRIYNETYLVMDGVEYLRASTELDLSGQQIEELEKIRELTALEKLNMRDTGITIEQYEMLRDALPACEILWSVPFQGCYCDNTAEELVIETLSMEDLEILPYLPNLVSIKADQCRDYDALFSLMEQRPEIAVSYTVSVGDQVLTPDVEELTIADPNVEDLLVQIARLPNLKQVTLEGTLPSNEEMLKLKEAFPNTKFYWEFSVCGVKTNSFAKSLDLSKKKMDDTKALEAALPCFYNLKKVDMVDCGLSNSAMEKLNRRHLKTSFVWKVNVNGATVRTDIKHFMFYKYGMKKVGDLSNLRYCTEIEVLDFGHFPVRDLSFIEYMPNLRFLLILQTYVPDLVQVGNCTSLEFLEAATSPIVDFWPLTNLTNLKALNLSHTPFLGKASNGITNRYGKFGDYTPLLQMTWLERLWVANSRVGEDGQKAFKEALPATEMVFYSASSTDRGWRYAPGYYEMRDILDLWYMVH